MKKEDVDKEMPDIDGLVTTTVLNTKIGEAENEIPNITDLVNKSNYITKISHTEKKYFTTADYNKFSSDILGKEIKQKRSTSLIFLMS